MSERTVFDEIISRQVQAVMFHNDMANIMDFCGLCGEKRLQEYRCLKEFVEMRSVERYLINHINYMPNDTNIDRPVVVIPSSWKNANRYQVSYDDRKSKIKELYEKWKTWETETKVFLQNKFKELTDDNYIASANKVNSMICDVDKELKELERRYIKYSSTNFDMSFICELQDKLHDYYEKKIKEDIKVEIC